jgi:hypothetical protein
MSDERVARNRLRLLPPIRRARLWRLYAENQAAGEPQRFLDFWMDGGRCLLGAKGTGIGTAAKAAVDTGLTRPFPSVREARLERLLLARHPDFAAVRFYRDEARAAAAAAALLPAGVGLPILMPFADYLRGSERGAAAEPYLAAPADIAASRVVMPRLPCPAALAPGVLLFRDEAAAASAPGDLVAPLALACAHRALVELVRFEAEYSESLWKRTDRRLAPWFERRGPWLYPRLDGPSPAGEAASRAEPSSYDAFFEAALGAGILLSPDAELPSIIPGDFDDGELARLAKALADQFAGASESKATPPSS